MEAVRSDGSPMKVGSVGAALTATTGRGKTFLTESTEESANKYRRTVTPAFNSPLFPQTAEGGVPPVDLLKAVYSEVLVLRQDQERLQEMSNSLAGRLESFEARMHEGLQKLETRLAAQQPDNTNTQQHLDISQLQTLQALSPSPASSASLLQVTSTPSTVQSLISPPANLLEQIAAQQQSHGLNQALSPAQIQCLSSESVTKVQELLSDSQQEYVIPQSCPEGISQTQPPGIGEEHNTGQPVGDNEVPPQQQHQNQLFTTESPIQLGFTREQKPSEGTFQQSDVGQVLTTSPIGLPIQVKRGEQISTQLQLLGQQQGLDQEDMTFLTTILFKSSSRTNFAVNMVRRLVPFEVRKTSNCSGTKGKSKLDDKVLDQARKAAFQMFPLGPAETPQQAWRGCIKAIDESCRRLNYKRMSKGRKEVTEDVQPPSS